MLYENKAKTGGLAMKAGTGMKPSYALEGEGFKSAFRTYWINAPFTLPFFNNRVSWDIMRGASVTRAPAEGETATWSFTYSTRLAAYPTSPNLAVVGEVFGAAGSSSLTPDYKVGLRWEPRIHANFALTCGGSFDGTEAAGLEVGTMLFTSPFACIGGCKK